MKRHDKLNKAVWKGMRQIGSMHFDNEICGISTGEVGIVQTSVTCRRELLHSPLQATPTKTREALLLYAQRPQIKRLGLCKVNIPPAPSSGFNYQGASETVFSNTDDGYSSSRNIIGWQGLHRHSLVLPDRHKIHPNYIGYSNAQNGRER